MNPIRVYSCPFAVLLALLLPAHGQDARRLLEENHVTGGLIVHLGCGDGNLAAAFAEARPSLVVHALDADPANVEKTRAHFRSHPAADRLTAELWTEPGRLPHADHLVNLLLAAESAAALPDAEAMRVLSPGGTLLRSVNGAWKATVKPPPDGRGDWTHYQFDASNNPVGTDPACGLPRRFQWAGKPLWTTSHENMASLNAMVSAHGRVFTIIDEGPHASIQLPADWQLVARDAHNGIVLWKKPITQWLTRFWPWKSGPAQMPRKLIAIGNHVYAPLDINGSLIQFDAATGETLHTYENTAAGEEVIFADGILLVQVNPDPSNMVEIEAERRARRNFNYDGANRALIDHDKAKRIVAIRAATGEQLWTRIGPRVLPLTLASRNGNVLYHNGERVVCLDLATGNEKWASAPIEGRLLTVAEEAPTTVLHDEVAFFAWNRKMTALSMADGRILWTTDWTENDYRSPVTVMLMHGLVWSMNIASAKAPGTFTGREPATGEIVRQFDLPPFQGIGHHRCYKAKASGDFVLLSRSGVEYVDPSKESYAEHHWIRGACLYGILPANGMLYSTPRACACYLKGKLNGFTAMTPGPTGPSPLARPGEGPTEQGPAYGKMENGELKMKNEEWPTYRGDVARSGRTSSAITTDLKQSWRTDLGGELSSPTVAGGLVFVAQKDRNTIHALRAGDGTSAWQFTAGGTIDSPPTIDAGRVYFGAADGCVYGLRASDGALAWRTRAAPAERRVVAYGRLESAWPVSGSVLVQGGAVYCAAGRSSFLDGGIRIVKLDAESGKILMSQNVYDLDSEGREPPLEGSFDMAGALPDILSGDGATVFMRHLRFDREILSPREPAPHLFSPTGYLDANRWHRTYWVYGKDTQGGYGNWWKAGNSLPAGRIMVFDDESVYAFGRSFYAGMNSAQFTRGEKYILYASEKREGPEPDWNEVNAQRRRGGDLSIDWSKYRTTPIRWSVQLPFDVRAMVLADRILFAAGPYGDALRSMDSYTGKRGVRLAAASLDDGKLTASYAIDALPVFDGLAAAGGRLYLAGEDGSVRSFGAEGLALASKLGEPIEEIPEELLPSDEEYRRQTQELLGVPEPAAKGKGKSAGAPRAQLKGASLASDFAVVAGGKVVASELGYRLGAEKDQVAFALRKLEKPVTTQASWSVKMQAADGFPNPPYFRNGFLVFGDGPADENLVKCGIQFIRGHAIIIEGLTTTQSGATAALAGDPDRVFDVTVSLDLEKQEVVLKTAGQTATAKLQRRLDKVTHAGFAAWNAVTDFSALRAGE